MNTISEEQNLERNLEKLAAQRQLYSEGKRIHAWQLILSGAVPVCLALLAIAEPDLKASCTFYGITMTLIDIFWFTPWQKRVRESAALIQETFDCEVLRLPWNEIKAGKSPEAELVKAKADIYQVCSSKMPPLTEWYSPGIRGLPMHLARLVCQRSNCWWDAKQRRRYGGVLLFLVITIFATLTWLAIGMNLTMQDFVLRVLAPFAPALVLGVRLGLEQIEAARRLDRLKDHSDRVWNAALTGKPEMEIELQSRTLQDEILDNRRKNPPVFDLIFRTLRPKLESEMNSGASHLAEEAKRVINSLKRNI
jgi:hypothetical protein